MKFLRRITKTKLQKITISTIIALLAMPAVFYGADSLININKIHYGVQINNQMVGGLHPATAIKKLEKKNRELAKKSITLYWGRQTWNLKPLEMDVEFKTKEAVELAIKVGNTGNPISRFQQKINAWSGKENIKLELSFSDDMLDKFLVEISSTIDRKPLNPAVIIKDGKAVVIEGQTGLLVNRKTSQGTIEHAVLSRTNRSKKLPVFVISTPIKHESAVEAAKKANNIISNPIKIKYQDNVWEITKEDIIKMVQIEEKSIEGKNSLDAFIDAKKVKAKIELLAKDIAKEPQDAKFSVNGNRVVIVPSKEGISMNLDKAVEDINLTATNGDIDQREVLLTGTIIPPKFTTEKAQSMGVKEKLASFSTTYSSYLRARVANIHLLTRSLDGTIIGPGETFSLNKTIGPRSAAKGYKEAPVIVNGKLVPGLGGGICQVTTTMFNAIFFAGLPVTERRNHSFYISKYPTGRDATVSYPAVDLKFKNNTDAHILIKGYTTSNSVTIALYGTNPGRTVVYNTTGFSRITAFPIEKVPDPTLDEGVEKIIDSGVTGKQVTVYRTVKKNNGVLFKDTFISRYSPKVQVVRYGTKPLPVEEPSDEQTPTTAIEETP